MINVMFLCEKKPKNPTVEMKFVPRIGEKVYADFGDFCFTCVVEDVIHIQTGGVFCGAKCDAVVKLKM